MIDSPRPNPELRYSCSGLAPACRRVLARVAATALLCGYSVSCDNQVVEARSDTAEGEAILTALDHVAAIKWGQPETTIVGGKAAVAYGGGVPLSESTRAFLDEAFAARGWRWSTEDPLVPTGNCTFPGGDCRLKDPTELHLTFSVDSLTIEEEYRVNVDWLRSFRWGGGHQAALGGYGVSVARGPEGWTVEVYSDWIT